MGPHHCHCKYEGCPRLGARATTLPLVPYKVKGWEADKVSLNDEIQRLKEALQKKEEELQFVKDQVAVRAPSRLAPTLEDPAPREAALTLFELAPFKEFQYEDTLSHQPKEQSASSDNPITCKVLLDLKEELKTMTNASCKDQIQWEIKILS